MLQVRSGHGATALDIQQLLDSQFGWSVIDGLAVSPHDENPWRVTINAGEPLLGGETREIISQSVLLDSPDNLPRRDVLYISTEGDVAVESGDPAELRPRLSEGESLADVTAGEIFDHWSPYPYPMHDIDGTVIAEVAVHPLASGVSFGAIRDRRISAERTFGAMNSVEGTVGAAPRNEDDLVNLRALEDIMGGLEDLVLTGDLNASGFDITNVGTLTANRVVSQTAPSDGNDVMRYADMANYLQRSGGQLSGALDANRNNIENVGEIEARTVTAADDLFIPVVSSPSETDGHLFWNESNE